MKKPSQIWDGPLRGAFLCHQHYASPACAMARARSQSLERRTDGTSCCTGAGRGTGTIGEEVGGSGWWVGRGGFNLGMGQFPLCALLAGSGHTRKAKSKSQTLCFGEKLSLNHPNNTPNWIRKGSCLIIYLQLQGKRGPGLWVAKMPSKRPKKSIAVSVYVYCRFDSYIQPVHIFIYTIFWIPLVHKLLVVPIASVRNEKAKFNS